MNRRRRHVDLDAELQRLLEENYLAETAEIRSHIELCPCCTAQSRMIRRLRVDIDQLCTNLLTELDKRLGGSR